MRTSILHKLLIPILTTISACTTQTPLLTLDSYKFQSFFAYTRTEKAISYYSKMKGTSPDDLTEKVTKALYFLTDKNGDKIISTKEAIRVFNTQKSEYCKHLQQKYTRFSTDALKEKNRNQKKERKIERKSKKIELKIKELEKKIALKKHENKLYQEKVKRSTQKFIIKNNKLQLKKTKEQIKNL